MSAYQSLCQIDLTNMTVTHPGLPPVWGQSIVGCMLVLAVWLLVRPEPGSGGKFSWLLVRLPLVGEPLKKLLASPLPLLMLKLLMVAFFLLMIVAGLSGTPLPERNLATVLTWNLWWAGLVFSVFLLGTSWCAICPWDTLAQWLVRRRFLGRGDDNTSLNLPVPQWLQSVWPALLLFVLLTWLELGVGITVNPYATAAVGLLMAVMATVSLAVFRRKAFCRYLCPVGRTVGFYSQLSLVELRPIDQQTCAACKTLECYHGSADVEPCPTSLVMGRLTQNSYCTSCGNCVQSCPQDNIAWRLRSPSVEAIQTARPRWDEAWFMIGLLALTGLHGLTMMPFWEVWIGKLARMIGDSGSLLGSFTLGLFGMLLTVSALYSLAAFLTHKISASRLPFRRTFSTFAFVSLPLAFSYHMAHNLNHLVREGVGSGQVLANPFGNGTLPMSSMERYLRHTQMWISQDWLFAIQAIFMAFGFWVALQVIRYRSTAITGSNSRPAVISMLPMLLFVSGLSGFHLWMLMQPMVMRM